jgi:hypothetical protein
MNRVRPLLLPDGTSLSPNLGRYSIQVASDCVDECSSVTDDRPNFEVLTVHEVRRRYKLEGIAPDPVEFDESEVPDSLKHLILLARVWGIGDDVLRDDMIKAADPDELKSLKAALAEVDDELQDWLTSPNAFGKMSPAHLAFSYLGMTADIL